MRRTLEQSTVLPPVGKMQVPLDEADFIWNRACDPAFEADRPGDQALQAIILFHSLSMNGGIAHALEHDYPASARVIDHYRYFGAEDQAGLIEEARALAAGGVGPDGSFDSLALSDDEAEALDQLDSRLPDDDNLIAIFQQYLSTHPEDFARS